MVDISVTTNKWFESREIFREDFPKRNQRYIYVYIRVCQIFVGTKYQNGKNIPNYSELYRMSIKYN
jgi:hypothetical protein